MLLSASFKKWRPNKITSDENLKDYRRYFVLINCFIHSIVNFLDSFFVTVKLEQTFNFFFNPHSASGDVGFKVAI